MISNLCIKFEPPKTSLKNLHFLPKKQFCWWRHFAGVINSKRTVSKKLCESLSCKIWALYRFWLRKL